MAKSKKRKRKTKSDKFEEKILKIVDEKDVKFIDAVLIYCEDNQLDPEYTKSLMSPKIKKKLENEFDALNWFSE